MRAKDDADEVLLRQVMNGDRQALATLYARHAAPLLAYLAHLVGDGATAEDLVQELFLVVWRDAGRFRGSASVRAWLFGIAHNLGLMALRSERRQRRAWPGEDALDGRAAPDPGPADLVALAVDRQRLAAALAALPAAQRAVVELTFGHGLARAETAQVLGCPVGTVKSRLLLALRALAR
ncbi:MAG TPA: RNA polymerase sigma factor, partial [Anaerolineae bacterium]|nr:RNA polymerase sigma factor [Anaerolineae bacterium]